MIISTTFSTRNAALLLLILWLTVSAFYYIENLFSPNFDFGTTEATPHKILKYAACLSFSLYFCLATHAYRLLLFCALILLLSSLLAISHNTFDISTVSIMITGTMMPFILVPTLWKDRLLLLGQVIVTCGAIVGFFSIIELTLLAEQFESYWTSTSSIRSISTMFNPNNLGLYTGICLLLLPHMKFRTGWAIVFGMLLIFSLIASGSRTAWVSLALVQIYAMIVNANIRNTLTTLLTRNLVKLALSGIAIASTYAVALATSTPPGFETVNRGTDLYTVTIRWQNFLTFASMIDDSILLPDQIGERTNYIQDNFYLVALNSFGVIGVLLLITFIITHFSLRRSKNPNLTPWKLVFIFYMVSGLGGSQLNSFPNNQLFFLSMGALLVYRPEFLAARVSHPDGNIITTET